jgi:hypothetical protein
MKTVRPPAPVTIILSLFFLTSFSSALTHYSIEGIALPTAERIIKVATNTQLNDAIQNAQPGDRIVIADGSYNGLNLVGLKGTEDKPIVFTAENPRSAIISGSASGRNARLSDCEYLEFHNMRFTGGSVWGFTMGPAYSTDSTLGCRHIRIIGCEIDGAGQVLLKVNGNSSHIQIIGNTLYDSGMSGYGKPYAEGIYIGDGGNMTDRSHDILVQGNHLYNIGNDNNWGEGIDIKVQVYNIAVVDNLIERVRVNSQGAITVLVNDSPYPNGQTDPNILIARNIIHDVRKRSGGWNGAGISASSNGVTIVNNLIWDTDEASITATRNAANTTGGFKVYNNTLWDGILVNQSSIGNANNPVDPDLRNNLIRGFGGTATDLSASSSDFIGPLDGDAVADGFTGSGFQLAASSPAVGSGAALAELSDDLLRLTRPSNGYSYGAFEAVTGSTPIFYHVNFDLSTGGYLEGDLSQVLAEGSDASSVTAIPLSGFEFAGWSGDFTSSENPLTVSRVAENLSIFASFVEVNNPVDPNFSLAAAVNCAGESYLASDGVLYEADKYFTDGQTSVRYSVINGTTDDPLYHSERYGAFSYAVPLPDGDYTVTLMFTETYWTSESSRVFDVYVEQQRSIADLDIFKEVGSDTAYVIKLPVYLRDGVINIELLATQDKAKLSAFRIEKGIDPSLLEPDPFTVEFIATANGTIQGDLLQSISTGETTSQVEAMPDEGYRFTGWTGDYVGGENPLTIMNVIHDVQIKANFEPVLSKELKYAINCGGSSYLAADGIPYSADRYYSGGVSGAKTDDVAGTEDDPLYKSYRFKYTEYGFPVENGLYRVTLKLVESYWTADDRRIFDIIMEGEVRIKNLDLHKIVGHDYAYDVSQDVKVADGQLDISNPASLDNGSIAAILIERIDTDSFDSDNDGLTDLLELALKLNPFDSSDASKNSPKGGVVQSNEEKFLELSFRRIVGGSGNAADGYAVNGLHYKVECSPSLSGEWLTGSSLLQEEGTPIDNGDGTETVRVKVKTPIRDNPTQFVRLKVSRIQ